MPGTRIMPEKIEEVKALLATGLPQRKVAEQTGVSLATVNDISQREIDEIEQLRTIKKAEFIDKAWIIVGKYLNRLDEEEVIQKTPAQACTTVIGTLIDKTRLMTGEATEHVKHSYVAVWGDDDED